MSIWQAIVLGTVQGLTEFIPISSTAHLRIVPALLGWEDPGTSFSAVIQLGSLLAVFVYFAKDIRRLTVAALRSVVSPAARRGPDARLAWAIAAGTVPIVVLGLSLRELIETRFRSLELIAAMLVLVALALFWVERRARLNRTMAELRLKDVLVVGCFQALALLPGTSRSGATILGGMLLGLQRGEAARFSFLLGIPAILGAGLLQIPPVVQAQGAADARWALAAGLAAASISSYAAIAFLLRYLQTHSTALFIVYRLGLGLLVFALGSGGWIE